MTLIRAHLLILLCGSCCFSSTRAKAAERFNALVFSRTLLFRHASITNGIAALRDMASANGFNIDATEDSTAFTPANLAKYRVVILLSTSGEVFNDLQKHALRAFVENGGGLVGIHAAVAGDVATAGGWDWYCDAMCAKFTNHSSVVRANVLVWDPSNPSTRALPMRWVRTDEWYNFAPSPRGKAHVLAVVDESTYRGGTMGRDHPVAWCRKLGKGTVWYTALGHTEASYSEPLFLRHLLGGIQLAAGVEQADFRPN